MKGRIGIGAQMLGVARGAWEHAVKYAQERQRRSESPSPIFRAFSFRLPKWPPDIRGCPPDGVQRRPA